MDSPLFYPIAEKICEGKKISLVGFKGGGNFKETYHAIQSDGEHIALKVCHPNRCSEHRTKREIQAMFRCQSPYIAKLHAAAVFQADSDDEYIYMLEEFIEGESLDSLVVPGTQCDLSIVSRCALNIATAIQHLKELNLVHRDIKPANIMSRKAMVSFVVVDFGLVRDLSADSLTPTCIMRGPGTPFFAAPEQLNNSKPLIDWRTDQFCLGVTLAYIAFGEHPFKRKGDNNILDIVADHQECSEEFKAFALRRDLGYILKMINPWPIGRFQTPEALIQAIDMGGT